MIEIKMYITERMYEFTWLQSGYLCHHHGEQRIRSYVERDPQEYVCAALVKVRVTLPAPAVTGCQVVDEIITGRCYFKFNIIIWL